MLFNIVIVILLVQTCLASIEQVGDTQINLINVNNKLIKQNLIEIQCEYGLDNVFSKEFSTTDNNTSIEINCPRAIKQYHSQVKGFVPEETYVRSIELCESGVTPLWDYDRSRVVSGTSRRLETIDDLLAKRQEFLDTYSKMVNTDQLGCLAPHMFYGGQSNTANACNFNGVRYKGWKQWMLDHDIVYGENEETLSCWSIYKNRIKIGEKINIDHIGNTPSNVGQLFRCFIGK